MCGYYRVCRKSFAFLNPHVPEKAALQSGWPSAAHPNLTLLTAIKLLMRRSEDHEFEAPVTALLQGARRPSWAQKALGPHNWARGHSCSRGDQRIWLDLLSLSLPKEKGRLVKTPFLLVNWLKVRSRTSQPTAPAAVRCCCRSLGAQTGWSCGSRSEDCS